jgi:diguanylate cyclase (GGDEF)-like protein
MVENIDPAAYIPPPVPPAGGTPNQSGRQPQRQYQPQREQVTDIATVLSMPENVMPAAIQDAFLQLVAEVERLREEVERVRLHERFLVDAADRHPLLPVLNRRAFMAGLGRVLEASARGDLPGTLAFLHVDGIEAIRRTHGLLAGDAALAFVAVAIQNELRQTDLLSYLDSSDFAIALVVADNDGASAKLDRIVAAIQAAPLLWNEHAVTIGISLGKVHFRNGVGGEQLLNEACQAMISGTSALSS